MRAGISCKTIADQYLSPGSAKLIVVSTNKKARTGARWFAPSTHDFELQCVWPGVYSYLILIQNQICDESQILEGVLVYVLSCTFPTALVLNLQQRHFARHTLSPRAKLTTTAKISWVFL